MQASDIIAIYAAIVATGALALEVRRWVEAGPKLVIQVAPNMVMIDGLGGEPKPLVVVSVYNRGSAPTTITAMGVVEYANWWQRLRNRTVNNRGYVIPNPSMNPSRPGLPAEIGPNMVWKGFISKERDDVVPGLTSGRFYVVISTTHRDRDYSARVPASKS